MDEYEKLEEELKKVYEVIIYSRVLVSTEYLAFFAMLCQVSLLHRALAGIMTKSVRIIFPCRTSWKNIGIYPIWNNCWRTSTEQNKTDLRLES